MELVQGAAVWDKTEPRLQYPQLCEYYRYCTGVVILCLVEETSGKALFYVADQRATNERTTTTNGKPRWNDYYFHVSALRAAAMKVFDQFIYVMGVTSKRTSAQRGECLRLQYRTRRHGRGSASLCQWSDPKTRRVAGRAQFLLGLNCACTM